MPILGRLPTAAAFTRMSSACDLISAIVLPLQKYQSDTRAAMSRAARDVPPWKISGWGRESGFGFRA